MPRALGLMSQVERDHQAPAQEQQERLKDIEERDWGAQRREVGGHRGERLGGTEEREGGHRGQRLGGTKERGWGAHMMEAYVEFSFLTLSLQDREGEKK